MKVSLASAARRTGLAHSPASLLAWYPDAIDADSRVDLDAFTTAPADLPALPAACRLT